MEQWDNLAEQLNKWFCLCNLSGDLERIIVTKSVTIG